VELACHFAGSDTVVDAEFAIDALHLCTDRVDGDDLFQGYFPIGTAPGSVAHYLADDIFYSTNDISIEKRIFSKPLLFALPSGTIVLCNRVAARESDFTFDTVIVAPTHISSIQISCSIPFM